MRLHDMVESLLWPDYRGSHIGFVKGDSKISALTLESRRLLFNLNWIIREELPLPCDHWDSVGIYHGGASVRRHRKLGTGVSLCIMLGKCLQSSFAAGNQSISKSGGCLTFDEAGGFEASG